MMICILIFLILLQFIRIKASISLERYGCLFEFSVNPIYAFQKMLQMSPLAGGHFFEQRNLCLIPWRDVGIFSVGIIKGALVGQAEDIIRGYLKGVG